MNSAYPPNFLSHIETSVNTINHELNSALSRVDTVNLAHFK